MTSMTSLTANQNPAAAPAAPTPHVTGERSGNRRVVYAITEKPTQEGTRSFWTRIGAAWDNRDGSVTLKLDALPLSGTLQVRDDDRDQRRERTVNAPF